MFHGETTFHNERLMRVEDGDISTPAHLFACNIAAAGSASLHERFSMSKRAMALAASGWRRRMMTTDFPRCHRLYQVSIGMMLTGATMTRFTGARTKTR